MTRVLCVDFGSTFTKAVLLDTEGTADGIFLASASVPTTVGTPGADVLDGYRSICETLAAQGFPAADEVLACSSAGGGLRLAVVGYERSVTAEAGHRVGLSAGAKIVHVAAGPMISADLAELRKARPDVILLVGGTDGGNADVLLHNGSRLAKARMAAPIVVAGNVEAQPEVALALASTGRRFVLTENVLPQIGVINPDGARAAIRQMFLRHVIGGKGLSKGPQFAQMVRAATPDAMLRGVETLASLSTSLPRTASGSAAREGREAGAGEGAREGLAPRAGGGTRAGDGAGEAERGREEDGEGERERKGTRAGEGGGATWAGGDVLVFDIGGATTDVYSVVSPEGEDAVLRKEVVARLWHARTVEGDLGMRWNASGVVRAAAAEHLLSGPDLERLEKWAARVEADPAYLPQDDLEVELDLTLARVSALTAVRRHARPSRPGETARPLARLAHVIGSGGVLRHSPRTLQDNVLRAVTTDFGGGWKVPTQARTSVDSAYLLFAVGLLADAEGHGPDVAARLAVRVLASQAAPRDSLSHR